MRVNSKVLLQDLQKRSRCTFCTGPYGPLCSGVEYSDSQESTSCHSARNGAIQNITQRRTHFSSRRKHRLVPTYAASTRLLHVSSSAGNKTTSDPAFRAVVRAASRICTMDSGVWHTASKTHRGHSSSELHELLPVLGCCRNPTADFAR